MSSKTKRRPLCNCKLNPAVTIQNGVVQVCNNHIFDNEKMPVSFKSDDFTHLDKLIEVIKQKRLTVQRETVGWQNFLIEHNIQV